MTIVHVNGGDMWGLVSTAGFVPVGRYASLTPLLAEIGSISGMRFIMSDAPHEPEFVTPEEFRRLKATRGFVSESPIQGRLFDSTFISLAPLEEL